jgi:hypothetical protein
MRLNPKKLLRLHEQGFFKSRQSVQQNSRLQVLKQNSGEAIGVRHQTSVVTSKPAKSDGPGLSSSYPVKAGLGKWADLARIANGVLSIHHA